MPERVPPSAAMIALAGLVALAVAMGIGRFAFTPLLPMMQADGGLSLAEGGWLASANYLGYLVGALLAGRRRGGAPRLLRDGLLLVVVTTALMGAFAALPWWLAARFVAGVASAWALVGTAALGLARLAEIGQPQLSGWVFAGVGVGIALAGLACHLIAQAGGTAAVAWWGLAAAALVGMRFAWHGLGVAVRTRSDVAATAADPPAAPIAQSDAEPVADSRAKAWADARVEPGGGLTIETARAPATDRPDARPQHRRLVLCYGLFGFGYILPATFLPAQARALVADPAVFGWVWPVFGLAALVSTLLAARHGAAWPRRRLWAVAQLVMAAGVLLPALSASLAALVVAALCVGGTFMVITMVGLQEARAVAGARAQPLMAAMTAAFAAGQLAGPLLVGVASAYGIPYDALLWPAAGGLGASAALLGRGVSPTLHPRKESS